MDIVQLLFLVPVLAVGLAAAVHATGYLRNEPPRALFRFWAFFMATLLAMTGVVLAPNRLYFLLAWEAMGLASAGLVAFEAEEKSVRRATWIYLLACHAGACAIMLAFLATSGKIVDCALVAFVFAVIGFGLKIGFPPFHVWLPEAHPAAPAPASAVMSAAMIPLGFYGLYAQVFSKLEFCSYQGWTLLVLGMIGSLGGMIFALPQSNLKRLLAFSSVENMGIVSLGAGIAIIAETGGFDVIATCALAGIVLHILNHAFLKGALFLGAGSVLKSTGTLNLDLMGGLMKRMPLTGTLFTLNAFGLSGLPPLNGFFGELLIYISAFQAVKSHDSTLIAAGMITIVTLAFTGGLAAAAYTKAISAAFLGEPRSAAVADAVEPPKRMAFAQALLFVMSLAMIPVSIFVTDSVTDGVFTGALIATTVAGVAFLGLVVVLLLFRKILPRAKIVNDVPTWDCGYAEPTARMAYTATAFTQPVADMFKAILRPRTHTIPYRGLDPKEAAFATETDDQAISLFWRPIFTFFARTFQRAHLLQNGSLHLYILLIVAAVVAMLIAGFAL